MTGRVDPKAKLDFRARQLRDDIGAAAHEIAVARLKQALGEDEPLLAKEAAGAERETAHSFYQRAYPGKPGSATGRRTSTPAKRAALYYAFGRDQSRDSEAQQAERQRGEWLGPDGRSIPKRKSWPGLKPMPWPNGIPSRAFFPSRKAS